MSHTSKTVKEFKGRAGMAIKPIEIDLEWANNKSETVECDAYNVAGDYLMLTKIVQSAISGEMTVYNVPVGMEYVVEIRAPYQPPQGSSKK